MNKNIASLLYFSLKVPRWAKENGIEWQIQSESEYFKKELGRINNNAETIDLYCNWDEIIPNQIQWLISGPRSLIASQGGTDKTRFGGLNKLFLSKIDNLSLRIGMRPLIVCKIHSAAARDFNFNGHLYAYLAHESIGILSMQLLRI